MKSKLFVGVPPIGEENHCFLICVCVGGRWEVVRAMYTCMNTTVKGNGSVFYERNLDAKGYWLVLSPFSRALFES